MPNQLSPDFVPRKTNLGAHLVADHASELAAVLRRLLLLADGRRTVFTLSQMMPDRDVAADALALIQRGLLEDANALSQPSTSIDFGQPVTSELPDGWESASGFMVSQVRETLGVSAVDIVDALERADNPEAAREAMSQWYRALRNSRNGRDQADQARLKAAAILHGRAIS